MSTKIDLQLDVKADTFTAGIGEKSQNPKVESSDFRQVLDEAVSSRPSSGAKDSGKKLPAGENKTRDVPLESDNFVQKSLVSNRMIITTESNENLEDIETFAAKQGLASSSLVNLLKNEDISKPTIDKNFDSHISPDLLMSREYTDGFGQKSIDDLEHLTESKKIDLEKINGGLGEVISGTDKRNFGGKFGSKNIELQTPSIGSKILNVPLISPNEKAKFQINSPINSVNMSGSIGQSQEATVLGKDTIDQVVVNKHIKIRGDDVIIKSVVLEKNYFFKKYDKPTIKLDSIDLRENFLGLFGKENKFKNVTNSVKSIPTESHIGKLGAGYQSQYIASSELSPNSPNELKGKIDEQPNNLNRFNQFQNMTTKFADSLVNRLTSQINKGAWRIEMEMHPRSLGKVSVQMEMVNGNLEAQFFTSQNLTRDLILESVPRLREMLENNGTNNAQVSVELKNDGNSDKKQSFSEMDEQNFGEIEVKTDEDTTNVSVNSETPGRYDFLV